MKIITTTLLLMLGLSATAQNQDELQKGKILDSYETTNSSNSKATIYLIIDEETGEILESLPTLAELENGTAIMFLKKNKYHNTANHMNSHDIMAKSEY